jgi:hypothetical protein
MLQYWRRFKEANATERAYVIVLVVFFALFVVGAFFFDHAVVAVLAGASGHRSRAGAADAEGLRCSKQPPGEPMTLG